MKLVVGRYLSCPALKVLIGFVFISVPGRNFQNLGTLLLKK